MACLKHITTRFTLMNQLRRSISHQIACENSKVKNVNKTNKISTFSLKLQSISRLQLDDTKPHLEDICSAVRREHANLPSLPMPLSLDQRDIFFYSIVQISTTKLSLQSAAKVRRGLSLHNLKKSFLIIIDLSGELIRRKQ